MDLTCLGRYIRYAWVRYLTSTHGIRGVPKVAAHFLTGYVRGMLPSFKASYLPTLLKAVSQGVLAAGHQSQSIFVSSIPFLDPWPKREFE